MKYKAGNVYHVKLRSLEWLKCTYKFRHIRGELNVWHSTGKGGGLHIRKGNHKLFGTGDMIGVIFKRSANGRKIFYLEASAHRRQPQQIYDEWFVNENPINSVLPEELFEI